VPPGDFYSRNYRYYHYYYHAKESLLFFGKGFDISIVFCAKEKGFAIENVMRSSKIYTETP